MKLSNRILLFLVIIIIPSIGIFSQSKTKPNTNKVDSTVNKLTTKTEQGFSERELQSEITELKNQIAELSKNIADNKQTFYDSRLNLWNFILTAFGLVIVIAGYFGYRSIADKINELKQENQRSLDKSDESVKETKNDLVQRISENKADIKDFKSEQQKVFEKFEKEANERITKGLDLALQQAIEQVVKGSYGKVIEDLTDQVADLRKMLDDLKSLNPSTALPTGEQQDQQSSAPQIPSVKPTDNAFD